MDGAVVRALQPYIVTSWHGHRDDPDIPEAVRRVWQKKFAAGHKPRPGKRQNVASAGPPEQRQRQSNVDIVILDANPLEDISNIRAIHTVIRDGMVVDLDALPYERIFSTPGKGHAW